MIELPKQRFQDKLFRAGSLAWFYGPRKQRADSVLTAARFYERVFWRVYLVRVHDQRDQFQKLALGLGLLPA